MAVKIFNTRLKIFNTRLKISQVTHLRKYEEGYEEEEEPVNEASEGLGPDIAVAELVVGPPLGDDCCHQAGHQPGAVEEHVEAVGDEAEGVGPDPVHLIIISVTAPSQSYIIISPAPRRQRSG